MFTPEFEDNRTSALDLIMGQRLIKDAWDLAGQGAWGPGSYRDKGGGDKRPHGRRAG